MKQYRPPTLLKKKKDTPAVAESVAPDNPYLGIMLPYTLLHHLLMSELGIPVVATSGNISDEPICTDETEALNRLEGIADLFLVHNRPIARHVDDSIVRMMSGRELVLRRSRGYTPLPVHLKNRMEPVISVGAHLKNTVAFSVGDNVFISQHIGDLETGEAYDAFRNVIRDLSGIYGLKPVKAACDMHPDYFSTKFAIFKSQKASTTKKAAKIKNLCGLIHNKNFQNSVLSITRPRTLVNERSTAGLQHTCYLKNTRLKQSICVHKASSVSRAEASSSGNADSSNGLFFLLMTLIY